MEENNNLQNKIKNYFEKQSYLSKYNFDIVVTILAILFVVFVVFYLYLSSRIDLEKINWETNKCNPFYMPFGSKINNGGDDFNEDNLKNCLNDLTSNVAHDVLQPINSIVNMFSEILKFITLMMSQLLSNIIHLFNMLMSLFKHFMLIMERIAGENIIIFGKINNFLGHTLGFISNLYYQLIIVVDSIKLIFPMMALAFLMGVILPALIGLIVAIILLAVLYVIAVTLTPVFCTGCWAWAPVGMMIIITTFMYIFLIMVLVLYAIFATMCNDILMKLLKPISNDDNDTVSFEKPPGAP
tara:strand:- start:44 stop:937 length:894 start_codon:yes stop_codon:yes gene_type:complete